MEIHDTKEKSKASSKKRLLLKLSSFVLSAAIALSPGVVPMLTSARANAAGGKFNGISEVLGDKTNAALENEYINNLFFNGAKEPVPDGTLSSEQLAIYGELAGKIKAIAENTIANATYTLTRDVSVNVTGGEPDTTETTDPSEPTDPAEPSEPESSSSEAEQPPAEDAEAASVGEVDNVTPEGQPAEDELVDEPVEPVAEPEALPMASSGVSDKVYDNVEDAKKDFEDDIWNALRSVLTDYDLYLYWIDVSGGVTLATDGTPDADGKTSLTCTVTLPVSSEYQTSPEKMNRARTAAATAKGIHEDNRNNGGVNKLIAYCGAVKALNGSGGARAADGSEWRRVDIFASSTALTAADYALALDTLCEMTGGLTNVTVSGTKDGAAHTWNIVTIDGAKHFVDLTEYTVGDSLPAVTDSTDKGFKVGDIEYVYANSTQEGDKLPVTPNSDTHTHVWSTDWLYSKTQHWRYCTVSGCTETYGIAEHRPGPAATTTAAQTCLDCGCEIAPMLTPAVPDHTHTAGTKVREEGIAATCTEAGYHYEVQYCTYPNCREEMSRVYVTDEAINHKAAPKTETTVTKEATCMEDGSKLEITTCGLCGIELSRKTIAIAKTGHKLSADWRWDDTAHWRVCEFCGDARSSYGAHVTDSGTVVVKPTATEDGLRVYTCLTCKKELKFEVIKATGANHTHSYTVKKNDAQMHWNECACGEIDALSRGAHTNLTKKDEVITKETCGADGLKEVVSTCKDCGREVSRTREAIAKTGKHTYDKGVCKVCGAKDPNYVEPHTHTAASTWSSDETNHWHTCTVTNCKEQLDKGAHTSDEGKVAVAATSISSGLKVYSCTACGRRLKTEAIPATNVTTPSNPTNPTNPGNNISQNTQSGVNAPRGQIRSSNSVIVSSILTAYERERVQNGEYLNVVLTIDNINSSVSDSDKSAVSNALRSLSNYNVGQYLDINLYKTVGTERKQILASINALTITLDIPEALRGDRDFAIVRVHDGNATVLQDKDSDPNTITVETSLFSTYAIVYRNRSGGVNPNTGIMGSPYIVSGIIAVLVFVIFNAVTSKIAPAEKKVSKRGR